MSEDAFLLRLEKLLAAKRGKTVSIKADTELLDSGLIDSAGMIEVILLAEELSGATIDVESLEPEIFKNGRTLYETFFSAVR